MRCTVACLILAISGTAAAQGVGAPDIEVPAIVFEAGAPSATPTADEALDLANIVRSAARGVTTVQEAPAIVTVVTADEIRDRQFRDFQQIIETVPGWNRVGYWHSMIQSVQVRGQLQAVQLLHDGVSLFEPALHAQAFSTIPIETIKRVEMITGPGGVLWGSNSLLGIINVITKDAEDVEGVEVGGSFGDGVGDRRAGRAYLLAGASDIAGTKLKLFAHAAVESYQGIGIDMPLLLYRAALPQPSTPNVYGPLTRTDQKRSLMAYFDAKLTYDKLQLRGRYPIGKMYHPAGLAGNPVRDRMDPNDPMGVAAGNRYEDFDRYGVLEYRTRFAKDKAGIAAHAYLVEFVRKFHPLTVLAPTSTLQGGLQLNIDFTAYVAGAAIDGDIELTRPLRVLYGAEAFREWNPITNGRTGNLAGSTSSFPGPYDVSRLTTPCPREFVGGRLVAVPECPLTSTFDSTRTVFGMYVSPRFRPSPKLTLDAGARVSVAPASLGTLSYKANPSFAGAIVWNFIPDWHLKLNYTEGFRPPTFNGTNANGEGVQINGNPDLEVEQSQAGQVEINARIFKGERRIRELSFRVDGSYTRLPNLIEVVVGRSFNAGARGILSGEFLGKLYLQGGHRIELGYTWLRTVSADRGFLRNAPEHWFNLATVWSLWPKTLSITTNLRIAGAAEDANRLVEYRGVRYDDAGQPMGTTTSIASDLVLDRLPPVADLAAGLMYTPTPKFSIAASVFNALYGHSYQPDAYGDYEPHLEYLPNPAQGFRAYLTASLQY